MQRWIRDRQEGTEQVEGGGHDRTYLLAELLLTSTETEHPPRGHDRLRQITDREFCREGGKKKKEAQEQLGFNTNNLPPAAGVSLRLTAKRCGGRERKKKLANLLEQ